MKATPAKPTAKHTSSDNPSRRGAASSSALGWRWRDAAAICAVYGRGVGTSVTWACAAGTVAVLVNRGVGVAVGVIVDVGVSVGVLVGVPVTVAVGVREGRGSGG